MGSLVQYITSPCPVAAGCGALWASSRLSTPVHKKCIFSRKKFVQPVRSVLVRTCTANRSKLKRVIVCILDFCTPYRPYRLFEVRTQFFQMRTERSGSHCANLIVALPQETFPLGESSKSPLHFADHRDESVIVGYYTSAEVPFPRRRQPGVPLREPFVRRTHIAHGRCEQGFQGAQYPWHTALVQSLVCYTLIEVYRPPICKKSHVQHLDGANMGLDDSSA